MGLDFSHGSAHWAYGGFARFREALAAHEGIELNQMHGFYRWYSDEPHENRSWDEVDTPLKPLLDHSDCDGILTPEECAQVAPRLREVIDAIWPEELHSTFARYGAYTGSGDRFNGLELVEAMEYCAENGEDLEFC